MTELTLEALDVHSISESDWRVRDRRLPEHDALCVLGVIAKKDNDTYEALRIGQGFQRFTFTSFADAVQHFIDA
jgi:hypothetical protein